jgi:hypothetical protein
MARSKSRRKRNNGKYKSGLEKGFAEHCFKQNLPFIYEPDKFKFTVTSHYTPDWKIADNRYIETKGYFKSANRSRLLAFREQYPDVEILLLFQDANKTIDKRSKTTYGEWATKSGIRWSDLRRGIPREWWT